jgi:hypothetical protein
VTAIRGVKFTSVAIDEPIGCWTITAPTGATFQVFDGVFSVPAQARKVRVVPRARIPNAALASEARRRMPQPWQSHVVTHSGGSPLEIVASSKVTWAWANDLPPRADGC